MTVPRFTRQRDNDALVALILSGALDRMEPNKFYRKYFPAPSIKESEDQFRAWADLHKDVISWESVQVDPMNPRSPIWIVFGTPVDATPGGFAGGTLSTITDLTGLPNKTDRSDPFSS